MKDVAERVVSECTVRKLKGDVERNPKLIRRLDFYLCRILVSLKNGGAKEKEQEKTSAVSEALHAKRERRRNLTVRALPF